MSHAANLRNRQQRHLQSVTPAKRRKSSESSPDGRRPNGVSALINGTPSSNKFSALPTKDVKKPNNAHSDHSTVTVGRGTQDVDMVVHDSGDSSSEDEDEDSDDDQSSEDEAADGDARQSKSSDEEQSEEEDEQRGQESSALAGAEESVGGAAEPPAGDEQGADEELSFGDLLRARGEEPLTVDVSTFNDQGVPSKSLSQPQRNKIASAPSATSLGTVLTQALRTGDVDLLESCLQTPNLNSIRATIERLHSSHATTLLQRLAERLHKRPGRAGSLMVWVQWTIVAHGGYLANQPAAMKQLKTLYQVVRLRATSLQPLLALKGKLDMLEAQMQLRRNMAAKSQPRDADDDEEDVIYIEGEESDDAENEEVDGDADESADVHQHTQTTQLSMPETDSEDEGNFGATVNGISRPDYQDDDVSEDSDEDQDLIDDEAEESDQSDLLSEDVELEEENQDEEDEDSDSDVDEDSQHATQRKRIRT